LKGDSFDFRDHVTRNGVETLGFCYVPHKEKQTKSKTQSDTNANRADCSEKDGNLRFHPTLNDPLN
jgi:hypothetical protein